MRYLAYVLMFVMVSVSFVSAQEDINKLLEQLTAQDATTTAATDTSGATTTTTTDTTTTDPVHDAPEVKIQNTSYTNNGSRYTLTWTALQGTSKIEISVKNADTDMDYTKVQTVAGNKGSAEINLTSQGTYMVKFTPVDDLSTPLGPDQIMTIKVEAAPVDPAKPTEPTKPAEVKNPPQVGPAQDLLFGGLILIAILYFVYRFRAND